MANPFFQLTAAGLNAGTSAAGHGLQMSIATFKVGSGVNYIPDVTGLETALHGTILHSGTIDRYTRQADGSLCMICTLGEAVGPFEFGEIGIYLADGTLLASAAFPTLIAKYSSASGPVANVFSFNCFLGLDIDEINFTILASGDSLSTYATQVDLAAEIAARIAADNAEAAVRASAITNEQTARINGDNSEATTRYNADNYIQYLINNMQSLTINGSPGAMYEFRGFNNYVPGGGVWAVYLISVADDGNTQDVRGGAGFTAGGSYIAYNNQGGGQGGGYGWCWRIG